MTVKVLKKILKRFSKDAEILVNGKDIKVSAQVNEEGKWVIKIDTIELLDKK